MEKKLKDAIVYRHFQEFYFERLERSSLDEKIQIAYEFLKWTKALPVLQPQSSKSVTKAAEFRAIGNSHFRRKNLIEALRYYTKCAAFAPAQSQELAFAYANRSAALLELGKFHECLLDINRALQENFPEARMKKLMNRKKKCIAHFEDAVNWSKMLPYGIGEHLLLGKASLEELVTSFNPDIMEPPDHLKIPPPEIDFKNKTISNASGKIKIKSTPENKISIIATTNIRPGEILVVEKPFVSVLKEDFSCTHCAYCFVRTEALIHCPTCSMVMFCSSRCRENAFEKFHRVECEIFSMLSPENEDLSLITWTTFRTLLVALKQGQELDQMMNHSLYKFPLVKKLGHNNTEQFNSQNYSSVFHHGQFCTAKSFKDFSSEFSLSPFLCVAEWLYLLKHTSFFGGGKTQNFESPFTNREVFAASYLLRFLQCDFRAVKEGFDNMSYPNEKYVVRPIGHGLFPFMNLFSHSCEPHVKMFSYENNLVCRSIRPIKAGEEIFDCYDTPYYDRSKHDRISSLQEQYNFQCNCRPCQRSWPVKEKLPSSFSKVVSDSIGAKKFQEYASKFRKLKKGMNFFEISDPKIREFLCEYSSVLDKRFEQPCREFIDCVGLLELSLSTEANSYNIICE